MRIFLKRKKWLWQSITLVIPLLVGFALPTLAAELPIISTSIDRSSIRPGESAVITWSASNAVSCEMRFTAGGVLGSWASVSVSGEQIVSPSESGYYDFLCQNSDGQGQLTSAWDGNNPSIRINVAAFPLIKSFSASPTSISSGSSSILAWEVEDAAGGCSLVENYGVRTTASAFGNQITGQVLITTGNKAQYTVQPSTTTKYGLHCVNAGAPIAGWSQPTTSKILTVTVTSSNSLPPRGLPPAGSACTGTTGKPGTCTASGACSGTPEGDTNGVCDSSEVCCIPSSTGGTLPGPGTGNTSPTASYTTASFGNILGFSTVDGFLTKILGFLQGVIVTLAIIFLVIGGFLYITSAGNEGRAETAKKCILAALVGLALGIAAPTFIKEVYTILGATNPNATTSLSLLQIASNVLSFLLTIVGIIAIIMLILGGILYLTAAGNEDRIDQGKKIFKYSLMGIIIALASLVLVRWVAGFFS